MNTPKDPYNPPLTQSQKYTHFYCYLTLDWQMKVGEEKLWRKIGATTLNCAQGKNASQSLRFIMMGRKKHQTCYLLGEQGAVLPAIVDTVQFDQIH